MGSDSLSIFVKFKKTLIHIVLLNCGIYYVHEALPNCNTRKNTSHIRKFSFIALPTGAIIAKKCSHPSKNYFSSNIVNLINSLHFKY